MSDFLVRRKRRWLRLSLRSLLLLVSVIAVLLAIEVKNARRQRRAVQRMYSLGGQAQYDVDQTGDAFRITAWLRRGIGDDLLSHVVSANLRGTSATNEDLAEIAGLRSLERLDLSETPVTDDGIVHLKGLGLLRILSLNQKRR